MVAPVVPVAPPGGPAPVPVAPANRQASLCWRITRATAELGGTIIGNVAKSLLTPIFSPFVALYNRIKPVLMLGAFYYIYQIPQVQRLVGPIFQSFGQMVVNFFEMPAVEAVLAELGKTISAFAVSLISQVKEYFLEEGIGGGSMKIVNFVARTFWNIGSDIVRNTSMRTWAFVGAYLGTLFAIRYTGQIVEELIGYYSESARRAIGAPVLAIDFHKAGALSYPARLISRLLPKPLEPVFNKPVQDQISLIASRISKPGKRPNVLLYGPPGMGKTMVAKSLARKSGCSYIMMSGADLAQHIPKHVSEMNKLIRFAEKNGPSIIFIDEADALGHRKNLDQAHTELMDAFLKQTGEASDLITFVFATNLPGNLDEGLLDRVDNQIEVGPPDYECRVKILKQNIDRHPQSRRGWFRGSSSFLKDEAIKGLAAKTYGLSGRTLVKMVEQLAAQKRFSRGGLTEEMVESTVAQFVKQARGHHILTRTWILVQETASYLVRQLKEIWYFSMLPLINRGKRVMHQLAERSWKLIPFKT